MIPELVPRGPGELKAAAKSLGCTVKDLLVLDRSNDPFSAGTPATVRDGSWFAELWRRFGYVDGVHPRRVHYKAQSVGDVALPSGETYRNTEEHWTLLLKAAGAARDLALLDPRLFADRRNPESSINAALRESTAEPSATVLWNHDALATSPLWRLPAINAEMLSAPRFDTGRVQVHGYDYQSDDQPYLIEVWIEKSTMDDILAPLCRDLGANYTPGTGFTSKTRIVELLARGRRHGKPVRVFVVSDFDPAGSHMPTAIARNIEFYRDLIAPEVEFAVHHVGMTREWAQRYALPRTPIARSKTRNAQGRTDNFEAIHGEGCVELDALEALHPGALAQEIRTEITRYLDLELPVALRATERDAQAHADDEWQATTAPIRVELDAIEHEIGQVTERYRARLAALGRELAAELQPHRERLDPLWEQLVKLADDPVDELPSRPEPEVAGGNEAGWLYDSRRHWVEQLDSYRRYRSGDAA